MYCIRCGSQLKDGTKYCIFCGAPTAAVKKERPRSTEDDTVSIPVDFFSSRMVQDGDDDFTIAIPDDFIRTDAAPQTEQPDGMGDMDFTRMVAQADIREAMQAQPDSVDMETTRTVAKEHIREATQAQPDDAGEMDYTRAVAKEDIRAAIQREQQEEELPPIDVADIPDIPIPSDFIADEPSAFVKTERHDAEEEPDDVPEQLMSRRGMMFVIIVVVLLFSIAVGACVTVLRGDTAPAEGSGSAEIGFWSPADGE